MACEGCGGAPSSDCCSQQAHLAQGDGTQRSGCRRTAPKLAIAACCTALPPRRCCCAACDRVERGAGLRLWRRSDRQSGPACECCRLHRLLQRSQRVSEHQEAAPAQRTWPGHGIHAHTQAHGSAPMHARARSEAAAAAEAAYVSCPPCCCHSAAGAQLSKCALQRARVPLRCNSCSKSLESMVNCSPPCEASEFCAGVELQAVCRHPRQLAGARLARAHGRVGYAVSHRAHTRAVACARPLQLSRDAVVPNFDRGSQPAMVAMLVAGSQRVTARSSRPSLARPACSGAPRRCANV